MFKRKKRHIENPSPDKVAGKIAGFVLRVQGTCADFMNKRLSNLSVKKNKWVLLGFCALFGGLSTYFIAAGVFGPRPIPLSVDPIKFRAPIHEEDMKPGNEKIDEDILQHLKKYKAYMDSTKQLIRPGLLDSMNVLEQIYLQQQKNEYEK